jgi:RyR domain
MTSKGEKPRPPGGTREALARAMHENYVREQQAKGDGSASNPSLVPWEEAEESLKASNRRFADGIGEKLRAAGCVVRPASSEDPADPQFRFTDEEVEVLARIEHDRWASDLERDGWRSGPVKDPVAKEHPLLVSWSELSEEDRDKDRAAVRNLPRMLLEAGFAIERVEGG